VRFLKPDIYKMVRIADLNQRYQYIVYLSLVSASLVFGRDLILAVHFI